jgi:hypothetical protein
MAIAVLISSVALLLSALSTLGTYRAVRRLESQIAPLLPQAAEFLQNSRQSLDEALVQFRDTGNKTQAVLDDVRAEIAHISIVRADLAGRLQAQMQRVEMVLDDAVSCVQTITDTMQGGVIRPLREVGGRRAHGGARLHAFSAPQRGPGDARR